MNVNAFSKKDYDNVTAFRPKKTNPIQTQNKACPERSRMGQFPIILVSLNGFCIISFSVMVTDIQNARRHKF